MLFIIGTSKTGKTTFTKKLCENSQVPLRHVQASGWARAGCGVDETHPQFREIITEFSTKTLREDPFFSCNWIKSQVLSQDYPCVLEGVRNPVDFMNLFRPHLDHVIFIRTPVRSTNVMDMGVKVIWENVCWMMDANILDKNRVVLCTACLKLNIWADPNKIKLKFDDNLQLISVTKEES